MLFLECLIQKINSKIDSNLFLKRLYHEIWNLKSSMKFSNKINTKDLEGLENDIENFPGIFCSKIKNCDLS